MKKRLSIISIILFVFIACGYMIYKPYNSNITNDVQLTEEEKLEDFEYMHAILKENYPYFEVNKRLNGIDWLSKKDEYIDRIKATTNDDTYFNELNSILSELKNGHTNTLDKWFYSYAKDIYERDKKFNKAWVKQLNNPKAINRYSNIPESKGRFEGSENNIIADNIKTHTFEKEKIGYLAIHSFNTFNIEEDMKTIKPFLESIKDYKGLIIDIRGNGGGDTRYWSNNIVPMLINNKVKCIHYSAFRGGDFTEAFLESRRGVGYGGSGSISDITGGKLKNIPPELSKDFKYYDEFRIILNPKNSIGFNGKIYLLTDGGVFSAAEAFSVFAKSTEFATLVGETTGGDGIGSDPAVCTLPNSGYVFRFTKEMGLTSDGTCNFEHKTVPDIKVSAKIGVNFNEDEAIQTVLKLLK
ncbi:MULTISPECIES: S41 family peptidase [unclassified Clostridium]|uniref:S41 family peptidase n=1 Tax=unclassified Clostridium TaxID=2614128 RepID=UPI0025BFDCAD|nr:MULTISPECIES: S41 family peptidase [unclassified Clostridium]